MSLGTNVHAPIQHPGKDQLTVANVEPKVILQLLGEIENLEKMDGVSEMTKGELLGLRIDKVRAAVSGGTVGFDATRWSRLSDERQTEIHAQLAAVRDELGNGVHVQTPRPVTDIIPADGGWDKSMIWLTIFGVIFAATLLSLIR